MATRSAPPRTPRRSTGGRSIPPPEKRIRWLLIAAGLFLVVCFGRAVQMQIVDGGWYANRATSQHRVELVTTAPRGAILDRDGYRLALTEQASTIGATTSLITDPARVVAAIAEASGESPDVIMKRLETKGPAHVDLARQVPA
ncbi:MAG: hypothetical protein WCK20_09020, partial [Thermoleophilia bacterium]